MTQTKYRTHTCGQLRMEHVGQTVTLAGWMENLREVVSHFGSLILRDFYGTTPVVITGARAAIVRLAAVVSNYGVWAVLLGPPAFC